MSGSPVTHQSSEFENRVHQLEIIEEKVADLMEIISEILKLVPINLESAAEGPESTLSTQAQLDAQIKNFGVLLEEIQSELRQHFLFMGEKGVVSDLNLPILSRKGPEKIDNMLWKAIISSLNERCCTIYNNQ